MSNPADYEDKPEEDLDILYPNRKVTIAGKKLVVHEYGFEEGIDLAPYIQPIVEELADDIGFASAVSMGALRRAFAKHKEDVFVLISAACGQPVEWVRALGDRDGDNLLLEWYAVNSDFFVRRVVSDLTVKRKVAQGVAGLMSTPPSPKVGTTRKSSGHTRAVN